METSTTHNARLRETLLGQRILAWPFPAAVMLRETTQAAHPRQPRQDWHVVDQWYHMGSFARRQRALAVASRSADVGADEPPVFDRDAYGILLGALRSDRVAVLCASSGEPLPNPLRPDLSAA